MVSTATQVCHPIPCIIRINPKQKSPQCSLKLLANTSIQQQLCSVQNHPAEPKCRGCRGHPAHSVNVDSQVEQTIWPPSQLKGVWRLDGEQKPQENHFPTSTLALWFHSFLTHPIVGSHHSLFYIYTHIFQNKWHSFLQIGIAIPADKIPKRSQP